MQTRALLNHGIPSSCLPFPQTRQSQLGQDGAGWEGTAWIGSTNLSISAACIFVDGPSLTPTVPFPCHSCLKCLLINKTLPWQTLQCRKGFEWWKMWLTLVRKRGCSASTAVPIGKRGGLPWPVEPQPESYGENQLQHLTLGGRGTFQKSQTNVAAVSSLCQWDPGKISPYDTANSPFYSLGSLIYPGSDLAHTLHTYIHPPNLSDPLCFTGNKQINHSSQFPNYAKR